MRLVIVDDVFEGHSGVRLECIFCDAEKIDSIHVLFCRVQDVCCKDEIEQHGDYENCEHWI